MGGVLAEPIANALREVTFQEALAASEGRRRYLLLGNGFSIAAHQRFNYASLYAVASEMMPSVAALFDEAQTANFEVAMQASFDPADAALIKLALIKAIAKVHP